MEEKYKEKKESGPKKAFKGLLKTGGSVIGAGTASLITYPLSTAYGLYHNIHYMSDGQFLEGLSNTLTYGLQATGIAAVVGGVAGLLLTKRIVDGPGYLFGSKKR